MRHPSDWLAAASHSSLAALSAQAYVANLTSQAESTTLSSATRAAIGALVESLANALTARTALSPTDVPFTRELVSGLPSEERPVLINQYSLGLGNPEAPVIVMGTEHAYKLDNFADVMRERWGLESLALENCCSALVWLADADSAMVAHICSNAKYATQRRSFHRHPSDYSDRVPSGHTWRWVARCVGAALADSGDYCYQIERSSHPAKEAFNGASPSAERIAFLTRCLEVLRQTARTLILHGRAIGNVSPDWESPNRALSCAFLGTQMLGDEEAPIEIGRRRIRWWRKDERKVLWSWALNGRTVNNAYSEQIFRLTQL